MSDAAEPDSIAPSAKIYREMVAELLAAAYDRRKTMDSRGATIVTTNSALLALVIGLTVVVAGKDYKFTSGLAVAALLLALLAFLASAAIAQWIQAFGISFSTVNPDDLKELVVSAKFWSDTVENAVREDAYQQVKTISALVDANAVKAKWVTASLTVQFIAVVLLVISICLELAARNEFSPIDSLAWFGDRLYYWFS